ncbi:MAG: fatty-acyl-CoA synthase [Gammaproteobacteria bacterium]|jgi:fatty-acyl-CoA synthase
MNQHGLYMAPPSARTLPALLAEMAARYPHQEFVVDGAWRLTYAAFEAEVEICAKGLIALGVGAGDKVAILMGNQMEWLVADFAIIAVGGVMVSVNTWASARELTYMLEHSECSALVMVDEFAGNNYLQMLATLIDAGRLAGLRHIVRVHPGSEKLARSVDWAGVRELGIQAEDTQLRARQTAIASHDVAYILYTSGSASTPKGVQLQHGGLIENMWQIGERQHLRPGDRLWLSVSLFWGLGCENALFAMMTHAAAIVIQRQFDPAQALSLIEREQCSVIYATPNMVHSITADPSFNVARLASLRTGATLGTPQQIKLLAGLGVAEICNIYGMTETYGNCTVTDALDPLELRSVSVGKPLPCFELKIVDSQTGTVCAPGQVGEILVRGHVTCGYLSDGNNNQAAFDGDSFFMTGDLGYLDGDGNLYFRGRLKEMIKTGGINVAPVEVEEILMSHAGVAQAFVVPLADTERDEIVAALVVPNAQSAASEQQLRSLCATALAAYKRPRRYLFVDVEQLPLTSTGKVRKLAIPELFESSQAPRPDGK